MLGKCLFSNMFEWTEDKEIPIFLFYNLSTYFPIIDQTDEVGGYIACRQLAKYPGLSPPVGGRSTIT